MVGSEDTIESISVPILMELKCKEGERQENKVNEVPQML
jgi:hypothetical protein